MVFSLDLSFDFHCGMEKTLLQGKMKSSVNYQLSPTRAIALSRGTSRS